MALFDPGLAVGVVWFGLGDSARANPTNDPPALGGSNTFFDTEYHFFRPDR